MFLVKGNKIKEGFTKGTIWEKAVCLLFDISQTKYLGNLRIFWLLSDFLFCVIIQAYSRSLETWTKVNLHTCQEAVSTQIWGVKANMHKICLYEDKHTHLNLAFYKSSLLRGAWMWDMHCRTAIINEWPCNYFLCACPQDTLLHRHSKESNISWPGLGIRHF